MALRLRIRPAREDEADLLTALIMRSKAHWGYDSAWLEAWRPDLTLDAGTIARDAVFCAEDVESGAVAGVSHLYRQSDGTVYLDDFFIDPAYMGQGVGAQLWRHAVEWTAAQGALALELSADPNARPFYEHMGAVVVGWQASSIVPGRRLPQMRYELPPDRAPTSGEKQGA